MTFRSGGGETADRIGRLYDRCAAGLYRYALMILVDPSAAADAVHDVFVAMLEGAHDVQLPERYLRRAVRNECYSVLRRQPRHAVQSDHAPLLEAIDENADPDVRLILEQAIRELPPEQREVLHLKAFEGLTFQEIADVTAESINTVASRYRYALGKMRALLGQRS